ncbi:MAG: acetyl-/propionyl-CoA carboxylase subunit alpha, partial [Actinobacteria bacterium QS_8_72_14]
EWDLSDVAPAVAPVEGGGPSEPSRTVTVEVGGKRLEVALFEPVEQQPAARPRRGRAASSGAAAVAEEVLTAPMQGTIIKTAVTQGETVSAGDLVAVLEAMKMENQVAAHRDGVVAALHVAAGDTVTPGSPLVTIEDA